MITISAVGACKVETLVLPKSVKILEHNAFGNVATLEEITLLSKTKVAATSQPIPVTIQRIKVPSGLV